MEYLAKKILISLLDRMTNPSGKQLLSILIYHRVLTEFDPLRPGEPTALEFSWQMENLSRYFNPMGLADAIRLLKEGKLPKRAICVTFDDGYADNEAIALPILKNWNIPATVFVATEFLNDGRMWNDTVIESFRNLSGNVDLSSLDLGSFNIQSDRDRIQAINSILPKIKYLQIEERTRTVEFIGSLVKKLPNNLMLTSDQVINLHNNGIEIGGHTASHPILQNLDITSSRIEIEKGKIALEKLIRQPVRFFAYPNGIVGKDFGLEHSQLVKELGFEVAVSTQVGVSMKTSNHYLLPRFTPWDKTPMKFMVRLLLNQKNYI
ncbi:MAG: polysaccharide deacetylase family protein [Sedimenticola sp.]